MVVLNKAISLASHPTTEVVVIGVGVGIVTGELQSTFCRFKLYELENCS